MGIDKVSSMIFPQGIWGYGSANSMSGFQNVENAMFEASFNGWIRFYTIFYGTS